MVVAGFALRKRIAQLTENRFLLGRQAGHIQYVVFTAPWQFRATPGEQPFLADPEDFRDCFQPLAFRLVRSTDVPACHALVHPEERPEFGLAHAVRTDVSPAFGETSCEPWIIALSWHARMVE